MLMGSGYQRRVLHGCSFASTRPRPYHREETRNDLPCGPGDKAGENQVEHILPLPPAARSHESLRGPSGKPAREGHTP